MLPPGIRKSMGGQKFFECCLKLASGRTQEGMKPVIVMLRVHADEWVRLLKEALPGRAVVSGAEHTAEGPAYVVTGKPDTGVLEALGPIAAVFSLNAGIEALLEPGVVPDGVPIVRMVDEGLGAGMLDWVLATIYAWHRNLHAYRDAQREGRWAVLPEKLARERQICILGAGVLAAPIAAGLAGLEFAVRCWSRTPKEIGGVTCLSGAGTLHDAVDGADILVNLLPLTPLTENILNADLLGRLAPGGMLVNAGRGRHLVDADILALLDGGHLSAAFLDVFREEPLPQAHPFWTHRGIYLTPHVAAPTHARTAVSAIAQNILQFEAGGALRHVVDRARGY
jgi:glyoxylate/hydroxypyruvate reductase A